MLLASNRSFLNSSFEGADYRIVPLSTVLAGILFYDRASLE